MMPRVTLKVSGTQFELDSKCLEEEPFQRLPLMVKEAQKNGKPLDFVVDRPVERFSAIVAYYQTGELHIPGGVCPGAFQKELLYWDIDSNKLAECCLGRYISFLEEQETSKKFRQEVLRAQSTVYTESSLHVQVKSGKTLAACRKRLWNIVDNNESSVFAKMYFLLLFLMVIISVFSLALSTEKNFMRKLNMCEMLEYLEYTKSVDFNKIKKILGNPSCDDIDYYGSYDWDALDDYLQEYWSEVMSYYMQNNTTVNNVITTASETTSRSTTTTTNMPPPTSMSPGAPPPGSTGPGVPPTGSMGTGGIPTTPNVGNVTVPHVAPEASDPPNHHPYPPKRIEIPDIMVHNRAFDIIDIVLMSFFTLDILLRLMSCPSIPKYFLSVINVIDVIALVGSYIHVIITALKREQRYVDNWIDIIAYFQILRTLRLFRVVKNVRATKVLVYAVKQSFRDLLILLMFLLIAVCTFASIVYFAEDRDNIESIPDGWWWALVTLTTVGYGDIAPKTAAGRLAGSVCAVSGVILISLTLPIFVNNFLTLYQYAIVDDVLQAKRKETMKGNVENPPYADVKLKSLENPNKTDSNAQETNINSNTLTLAGI